MDIIAGSILGPYEILGLLGAGGMGEVYRARDTRLDRHVALKVLPRRFAENAPLRARFEREARTISALSHPHICSLFDVGSHDGTEYLVMELLEGESLADRLARGAMPVEQVVRYGAEIASALEAAHRRGMIHRDLKPGNIMLTRSGAKLLDFGLAQLTAVSSPDEATETVQKPITEEGAVMGTLQYMAPEQLEGRQTDARTDIFALGAVLYEMVTGKRAFGGATRTSVVAAVLGQQPEPVSALQPMTPTALERVIRTCLAKDREDRWQTAHDVMLQLRSIGDAPESSAGIAVSRPRNARERVAWIVAAIMAMGAIAIGAKWYRDAHRRAPLLRVAFPASTTDYRNAFGVRLSRDGSFALFTAEDDQHRQRIWLRRFSDEKAVPIEGTERGSPAAIAPGGGAFLMYRGQKIYRVDFAGGAPIAIGDSPETWGATWIDDATIVFAHEGALWRVSAGGGKAERLLQSPLNGYGFAWPEKIPGHDVVLYVEILATRGKHAARLHAFDLRTRKSRVVGETTSRTMYRDGHLLSVAGGSLLATPFDVEAMKATGEPRIVASNVSYFRSRFNTGVSASETGLIAYEVPRFEREMRWFTRDGRSSEALPPFTYQDQPSFSPDGRFVASGVVDPTNAISNLWVFGVGRATRNQLAFSDRLETTPLWTPDGKWIIYQSDREGPPDIYRRRADGSGSEELLYRAPGLQTPSDVSPDGKWLAFTNSRVGSTASDVLLLSLDDRTVKPWANSPARESWGAFSRDGRWMAYCSDKSGRSEVYVRPFPGGGDEVQISTTGATMPKWSHDGKELVYLSRLKIMSVDVTGGKFGATEPRELFDVDRRFQYWQPAPDGRFLIAMLPESMSRDTQMIVNWR